MKYIKHEKADHFTYFLYLQERRASNLWKKEIFRYRAKYSHAFGMWAWWEITKDENLLNAILGNKVKKLGQLLRGLAPELAPSP